MLPSPFPAIAPQAGTVGGTVQDTPDGGRACSDRPALGMARHTYCTAITRHLRLVAHHSRLCTTLSHPPHYMCLLFPQESCTPSCPCLLPSAAAPTAVAAAAPVGAATPPLGTCLCRCGTGRCGWSRRARPEPSRRGGYPQAHKAWFHATLPQGCKPMLSTSTGTRLHPCAVLLCITKELRCVRSLLQARILARKLYGKRVHPDVHGRCGAVRVRILYKWRAVRAARCVRVQVLQAHAPAASMRGVRATACV